MLYKTKKSSKLYPKKLGNSVKILGVRLNSTSSSQLLKEVIIRIKSDSKTFIVTPNSEFLTFAQHNPWFKQVLNSAEAAIPDGIGLIWAGKFLGSPIEERIHGTDFMEELCSAAAKEGLTVYFLGGRPGVAQRALESLQGRYLGLKGWAEEGPPEIKIKSSKFKIDQKWVEKINQHAPDLLFVGLGMGKQEKFIYDNWKDLKVKLAIGVGGAFDYFSGRVPRAPVCLRKIGLEWFYRLLRQPWRVRRQLALLKFIGLVLKEKVSSRPSV